MKTGIVLMGLILLLLLAAVLPIAGDRSAEALYYSPVTIVLLGLLAGSCAWCCRRRRRGWRQAGFLLAHLGVAVVLAGAGAGFLFGARAMVRLPLRSGHRIDTLTVDARRRIPLGFEVAARDFEVAFYPPTYVRWHPLPPGEVAPGDVPFRPGEEFEAERDGPWDLGDGRTFDPATLWNAFRSEWVPQYSLPDGTLLAIARQTPRFFGFTLTIADGDARREIPVEVNRPATHGGWRFYLMSYDTRGRSYVDLSVRRDPGRTTVIAGIWMLIAGVCILCFRRTLEASDGMA